MSKRNTHPKKPPHPKIPTSPNSRLHTQKPPHPKDRPPTPTSTLHTENPSRPSMPSFPAHLSPDIPNLSRPASGMYRVEILPTIEQPTTTPLQAQPLHFRTITSIFVGSLLVWLSLLWPYTQPLWPLPQTPEATLNFLGSAHRALGVLLASTLTLTAIAIPLTANNYTPKLISLFLKNHLNQAMFALFTFANVFTLFAIVWSGTARPPLWPLAITGFFTTVSFLLIIPYAFYVFRDLQPEMIICNIGRGIIQDLSRVPSLQDPSHISAIRHRVIQDLKYLSNITLRSVERHDRDTASFSIDALRCILDHYFKLKDTMPPHWFEVQRSDFLAHSGELRRQFQENRTFLEGEVMEEFAMILAASFGKLHDIVRMLGETMSYIGMQAQIHNLPRVLETTSLYFNTYLRAAISLRQPNAIYMLVFHYRKLAEALMLVNPERTVKITFYLDYYGHQAVRSGMVFVANLIAYDLADLTALAYQRQASCRKELFQHFLQFDNEDQMRRLPGVIKSHIKLATTLYPLDALEEVDALCLALQKVPHDLLSNAFQQIDGVQHSTYWEVTDRRKHNDYIEPAFRPYFDALRKRLHASPSTPPSAIPHNTHTIQ